MTKHENQDTAKGRTAVRGASYVNRFALLDERWPVRHESPAADLLDIPQN